MTKDIASRYLQHVAKTTDLVQELRSAKAKQQHHGQQIIFHKMIKEVSPRYKFYKFHAVLIKELQKVIDGECTRLIISVPPRFGKLCAHDTPVFTPNGWTTHGDLKVGDYVYSADGRPTQVIAISDEGIADYCVTISNGDQIWCHGAHEWTVELQHGDLWEPVIMETSQLRRYIVDALNIFWLPVVRQIKQFDSHVAYIKSIEHKPEEARTGRCIQVSSNDGLYLVGKRLTPTHNSELSSRLLPAAYLLAHPERYVAICSYSAELAETFSREARDYYQEAGGTLDPSNKSVSAWGTEGGGGCWATGIGGAVTGRSASLIIADDTVKGREEADSKKTMEKLWSFYQGSLYTRLEPDHGAIVIVATRWSESDLTGRVLELERESPEGVRENWTIIDLPAISEDPGSRPPLPANCKTIEDWRKEPGIALCPQRYDVQALQRIRQAVGPREWSALYQQRPAPEGGNMFNANWWNYYQSRQDIPAMDRVMLSVDCTFTGGKNSDYVVGLVVGQNGPSYYVLDMFRERTDINGTLAMILNMYKKHELSGAIIELAASGHAAFQILQSRVPGLIGYKPGDRSKTGRLAGIVPVVEAGNVYLPSYVTWLDIFLNEFNLFPAVKNDDICDALAQAINYMNSRSAPAIHEVHWGRASYLPAAVQKIGFW